MMIVVIVDFVNENSYRYRMEWKNVNNTPFASAPEQKVSVPPAKVSSDVLLGAAKELLILHEGREYRLRRTQNGRLILTA